MAEGMSPVSAADVGIAGVIFMIDLIGPKPPVAPTGCCFAALSKAAVGPPRRHRASGHSNSAQQGAAYWS